MDLTGHYTCLQKQQELSRPRTLKKLPRATWSLVGHLARQNTLKPTAKGDGHLARILLWLTAIYSLCD